MKTLLCTSVLIILTLGSCTSTLYTGAEYDDLYYTSSDKAVVSTKAQSKDQLRGGNQKPDEYYDNKYATDTLFADQYSDAVDIDNQTADNYNGGSPYEYYDDYSYTDRLRRFHGNYFDPYWRDPTYFSYGYPSFGFGGFGGYPYSYYDPYSWSPYYGDYYGGYNPYYGGYSGGYYRGFYSGLYMGYGGMFPSYYGGFYAPYYSGFNTVSEGSSVAYGRRERPSSLSSKWNSASGTGSTGRTRDFSAEGSATGSRRASSGVVSGQSIGTDSRRQSSALAGSRQVGEPSVRSQAQDQVNSQVSQDGSVATRRAASARPDYGNSNRAYTPSYSNPRMSTRPSYNNSRISEGVSTDVSRSKSDAGSARTYTNPSTSRAPSNQNTYQNQNNSRSNSQGSSVERRVISPSGSSGSYSVPSRRSAESSSGYSSGSSNSSNSSYSGGRSSSSYNSGSSGSSSGGSYSSGSSGGSSSGSTSSGSTSSGSSSSGRR